MNKPIVWSIAGSDCSGGAGIQADLHVFNALGVHGCSVITAITSQNNDQINQIEFVSADTILSQIYSLEKKFPANVIKIGMLGDADAIQNESVPLVQ